MILYRPINLKTTINSRVRAIKQLFVLDSVKRYYLLMLEHIHVHNLFGIIFTLQVDDVSFIF